MITKEDFYKNHFQKPLPFALWSKYPKGHIFQLWGENPELYAQFFNQRDDMTKFLGGHSGIDITTAHRDRVLAAHKGYIRTLNLDRKAVGGIYLRLTSENLDYKGKQILVETDYGHLDEAVVKQNQRIEKGELLGYEGNTGWVVTGGTPYWGNAPAGKGVHLHFGLREFVLDGQITNFAVINPLGNTIDPLPYLTGDWAGTLGLLENAKRLLFYWLKKIGG